MGRIFDADDRSDDSVEGLIMLCQDWVKPHMIMAEIGCYRGISTSVFAQYAMTVHAVDPWMRNYEHYKELPWAMLSEAEVLFDQVCQKYSNIIKHAGLSVDVAKEFDDESLDMIYLDGDHSEAAVKLDCSAWIPRVKPGGVISGHDYALVRDSVGKPAKVYPDNSWVYVKS